jgi:zinc protease
MKGGLAYSADSRLRAEREAGAIWIGLQTDRKNVKSALSLARDCAHELIQDGVGPEEFTHFQEFVSASMRFDFDSLSSLTSRRLEKLLFGEPWTLPERLAQFAQEVTLESTNAKLKSLLSLNSSLVCVLGQDLPDEVGAAFQAPINGKASTAPPLSLHQGPTAKAREMSSTTINENAQAVLHRLANGLHLLTLPRLELGSISVQVWSLTGSMDESPGKTGMSHLLEHLMFRGTPQFPDGSFDSVLAQRGGLNNAFTTEDFTVYTDYVTPEGLEEALCLEADRLAHLEISEYIFQTERAVVLEERSLRVDSSPLGKSYEKLQALAFPGHPYGHPVIGWEEDLNGINSDDVARHYTEATCLERLLVVVAGGCSHERGLELVSKTFGEIENGSPKEKAWPVLANQERVPPLQSATCTLSERSGYNYLLLCYRFPREGHPDFEACDLLSRIVGEGDSSRLYQKFVQEEQAVHEAWVNYEPQTRDHTLLHIGLASPEKLEAGELAEQVKSYLAEVWSEITAEELLKAKRCRLAERAFDTDELEDWALEIAGRVMLMSWDDVWAQDDRIDSVTLAKLREVARTYLDASSVVSVFLEGESSEGEDSEE